MLTKQQRRALDFIAAEYQEKGVAPSFQEVADHLGVKSKSGVHRIIHALKDRGFLVMLDHKARAMAPVGMEPNGSSLTTLALRILRISGMDSWTRKERLSKINTLCASYIAGQDIDGQRKTDMARLGGGDH